MNLGIESQLFLVTGATSGLGRAVAERLALEKGQVLAVMDKEKLVSSGTVTGSKVMDNEKF